MYLRTSLRKQDVTDGQFFKRGLLGSNSVFLFQDWLHTEVKETSLIYYLPIAEERVDSISDMWNVYSLFHKG